MRKNSKKFHYKRLKSVVSIVINLLKTPVYRGVLPLRFSFPKLKDITNIMNTFPSYDLTDLS